MSKYLGWNFYTSGLLFHFIDDFEAWLTWLYICPYNHGVENAPSFFQQWIRCYRFMSTSQYSNFTTEERINKWPYVEQWSFTIHNQFSEEWRSHAMNRLCQVTSNETMQFAETASGRQPHPLICFPRTSQVSKRALVLYYLIFYLHACINTKYAYMHKHLKSN